MPRQGKRYWIGVDGEGLDRAPHRYVYLAWSDAKGRGDSIERLSGLRTAECLELLCATPTNARVAGYYLGYDWTKILTDLPNGDIYRLLRPEMRALPRDEGGGFSRIHYKGFKLHYLSGMMRIENSARSVTIWDLGRFFQAPFIDSIEAWQIDAPHDLISDMKAKRSTFTEGNFDEVKGYCREECKALAALTTDLELAHMSCGLRPQVWYGPGSTASVGLRRMGIHQKRGEQPNEVIEAADRAFFGGRFEHSMMGPVDYCEGWDIASAYPFNALTLPCLEHGTWERVSRESDLKHYVQACVRFSIKDSGPGPWAPLPIRLSDGTIVYPRGGADGWCWIKEWRVARKNWNGLKFGGAWGLRRSCDCIPFASILEWYAERIKLGKSARGRVLKFYLNSLYGKLAQTIGTPKFASRIWAGMITSGTRAMLLELMCSHDDRRNVLALATDGLYTREQLEQPKNPLSDSTLGSWERSEYPDGMVFVRPGIYWDRGGSDDITVRARGFSRKQLEGQREAVLAAILRGDEKASLGTSTLFGGARACVYKVPKTGQLKRSVYYGEWHDIPARVNLTPLPKRNPDWSTRTLKGIDSAPYKSGIRSADAETLRILSEVRWASRQ